MLSKIALVPFSKCKTEACHAAESYPAPDSNPLNLMNDRESESLSELRRQWIALIQAEMKRARYIARYENELVGLDRDIAVTKTRLETLIQKLCDQETGVQ